jgi:hypothetical protein
MVWDKNTYYDNYDYYKKYREEHKQQKKDYDEKYREENKQKLKEKRKTFNGRKSSRISDWKRRGVLCFDFNLLYDLYINCNKCEICNVEFGDNPRKKNGRCLDHDHNITDKFNIRYVCCRSCNIKLK